MISSVTLQNFKSFGRRQEIGLEPITVLIGPNNSGKSVFLSLARFIRNVSRASRADDAFAAEGGGPGLFHRPPFGDGSLVLGWKTDAGTYETSLQMVGKDVKSINEDLRLADGRLAWISTGKEKQFPNLNLPGDIPFGGFVQTFGSPKHAEFLPVYGPLPGARTIRLSIPALRKDARPVENPTLAEDGSGLAQVLSLWRNGFPEKADQLDEFVSKKVLPELEHVLVVPAPMLPSPDLDPNPPGTQRLMVRQRDGQRFDATQVSDGVLCFIALAMHAIDLEPGGLLLIEEPEQAVHPTRLHEVVELLRQIVSQRKAQVVLATHSTVLLNEFRDEPERIRVFRRSPEGTQVRSLAELPDLEDALHRQPPGQMLEHGFFEVAFAQSNGTVDRQEK